MLLRVRSAAASISACLLLAGCDADPVQPAVLSPGAVPEPRAALAPDGRVIGSWSAPFSWPHVAAHMTVLPDGKVITWMSDDMDHTHQTANVSVWNPAAPGTFVQVPNRETDVFCAGHSFLPNGDLMVAGGHVTVDVGVSDANIFNWQSASWSRTSVSMAGARWYPTTVTLGSGDVAVAAGSNEHHAPNPYPEVWDVATKKWRLLGGAHLVMPYYPRMHLAPDGRVFVSGPEAQSRWLNPTGSGAWTNGPTSSVPDRSEGTAVMYQPGKVILIGGSNPAVNTAETIDLNVAGSTWQPTGPMQYARRNFSTQILADGRVLVVGGTAYDNSEQGRVLASELWNPATGTWTTLASIAVTRTYHSSSVLLLDGRILTAGGGGARDGGPDYLNAQLFTPPYLLNADGAAAARPTIASAPSAVDYGQAFTVQTPDAAAVARVTWVRLPSFTHAIDMNQRFAELTFSRGSGELTVTAPSNPNLVPPGHYMMFVLNGTGVPSVARVVQIRGGAPLPILPAPTAPTGLAAAAQSSSQIKLSWTDASDSETGFSVERCAGAGCASFAQIATVGANATGYADAGLAAGTSYSYRVRASNVSGPSGYSNTATATPSAAATVVPVVNGLSGRCMDVLNVSHENGAQVMLYDCHGGENQQWTAPAVGVTSEIRVYGNMCLDAVVGASAGTDGDAIIIYTCHGGANQKWTRTAAGDIRGINGKCVEAQSKQVANGTPLVLWSCDGNASQRWTFQGGDQPPAATFIASCTNLACTFNSGGSSDDKGIASRSWSFGDGTTDGNVVAPSKTYAAAGTYGVTLTVTDGAGQRATQTQSVTVAAATANKPPVAGFTAKCTGLSCAFTDASTDPDGTVASRSWQFGDAAKGASTAQNPTYSYAAAGTYTVTLTATDDKGATASTSSVVTVAATNAAPVASFTQSCTGLTCSFTDASTDGDGTLSGWSWSFGDGQGSTTRNPSHTYAAGGTYTVGLTVTDDKGATNSTTRSVTVTGPAAPITLDTRGYKLKGLQHVELRWTGATTATVSVHRDGRPLAEVANDTHTKSGSHTDNIGRKGSGSYRYKVCEAGSTTVCSIEMTVTF